MVIAMSYMKAYTNPYGKADLGDITVPVFEEIEFPFSHTFDSEKSLPFLGSGIIDVDNDGTPEVFVGGGYNQRDKLFKFSANAFEEITTQVGKGFEKPDNDTTYGTAVIDANSDGKTDIFIARASGIWLYLNLGDGFVGKNLDIKFNKKIGSFGHHTGGS